MELTPIVSHESIYSWYTRLLHIQVAITPRKLGSLVFGRKLVRIHPYLPAYINAISPLLDVSSEHLLNNHTAYPLFRHLSKGNIEENNLKSEMCHGRSMNIARLAGISASRLQIPLQHKICPTCIQEDISDLGFPTYRTIHQFPGVVVCPNHAQLLDVMACGDGYLNRRLQLPTLLSSMIDLEDSQERSLSMEIVNLWESPELLRELGAQFYTSMLKNHGFLTKQGSMRCKPFSQCLKNYFDPLKHSQYLKINPRVFEFEFISDLVHNRRPLHPIKHALFRIFLKNLGSGLVAPPMREPLKSATCTERPPIHPITLFTGELGQLSKKDRDRKIQMLSLLGEHRKVISSRLNVSVSYVEKIIQTSTGITKWRKYLRYKDQLQKSHSDWRELLHQHPSATRKQLRSKLPGTYTWLYRHDRKWLEKHLPPNTKRRCYSRTNWVYVDEKLCRHLRKTIKSVCSVSEAGRKFGKANWLLKNRKKLPKSIAYLESIVSI